MKKIFVLLACILGSASANAAFITLLDGMTPSAAQIEVEGTKIGSGFNVNNDIRVLTQFQLSALDETTDDLNGDGLLTVNFGYYVFNGTTIEFIGFDLISDNSILWSDINDWQTTADTNDELTFDSFLNENVPTPLVTEYSAANGVSDYYVFAYIDLEEVIGLNGGLYGVDLVVPAAPPAPVSSPATFGILLLGLAGVSLRRRNK
ncbi:hypothetical protein NQT74_01965 [Alteromonas stellipolaris]|uniref:PEP-CTERM protein-sorting domain-containing protein n=1 Tax=Alteromonas naphthalenivorans TaxID=715451 RepID=F5ZD29_ALTNA|nr:MULTISPECIES: hypothetical protein [Alteromonas]AEF03791.1 hypothetical protein ambt_11350 [Alteromonas naphthalenivorans]MCQ8847342.1 hypothetical protein [Alteromonas stellipolaris]